MPADYYDSLSIFDIDETPAAVSSPASAFFNDTVVGYVLTFRSTAILITTNPQPYFISNDIVNKYFLSTGDKVTASVSMESVNKYIVTNIIRVNSQAKIPSNYTKHFDDIAGVTTGRIIRVNGKTIKLGSTAMVSMKQNEFALEKITMSVSQCSGAKTTKIILGIQEKQESLNYILSNGCDYGYITTVAQPLKQQLMLTLTAFFRAKELAERGHDTILFINSFEKLLFLFNNAIIARNDLPVSPPLHYAERDLSRIIKTSKVLPNGGSLTIFGFFHKDGSPNNEIMHCRIATECDFII
jgi:transcription termination factor Rho